MAWLAFHTAPNLDPHATLVWRSDKDAKPAMLLRLAKEIAHNGHILTTWVEGYEFFGVRQNIEVAMLAHHPLLDHAVELCAPWHQSDWPIRPHVTAHEGRQTFTFQWVGFHTPTEHRYLHLGNGDHR